MTRSVLTRTGAAMACATALLLLSACGGSDSGTSGSAPASTAAALPVVKVDPAAAALLPEKYKTAGVLKAATDGTYPPNEFTATDGTTLIGFDIDLANAIGTKLGVKVDIGNTKFDSILTGISGGRYDWALSSMTDNKKRQETVDFVDYFNAGTSILVKKGNPENISKLEDLCGKNVAMESGTVQVKVAEGAKCAPGQKINVTQLPDDAAARLQVTTGRAVADLNDFPVAAYSAKTQNDGKAFEVVGDQYESAPYGVACAKGTKLDVAVQAALKSLIADGTYDAILKKWDITKGSLTTATINGGSGSGS